MSHERHAPITGTAGEPEGQGKQSAPPAWSTLGRESVPLQHERDSAETREREARLRLVIGRRRV